MSLEAFISVGMFFILPAAAFVIGAAGFFIRAITWRGYLVGGLSTCVVIPVGAYFLMGALSTAHPDKATIGSRTVEDGSLLKELLPIPHLAPFPVDIATV